MSKPTLSQFCDITAEQLEAICRDYDAALCSITMNLDEPRSAKEAQRVLDKWAKSPPDKSTEEHFND